jgi:ubiquinone/menaquinone biosynthesis C-methylase UbiE
MPDHFRAIYANQAERYDAMVSCEDYQGNLLPALERIRPLAGLHVVEFGAGTGRLTRLLAPVVASIRAFDLSAHMLVTARSTLEAAGLHGWELAVGDNRSLPVADHSADLAIAGWSFGHSTGWYPDRWREEIDQSVGEMLRVLKPEGTAVILETLGTGSERPVPPNELLAAYYQYLEQGKGFSSMWIRTDYRFDSVQQADELTRFFFGDALADRIVRDALVILPECTGIWWKHG